MLSKGKTPLINDIVYAIYKKNYNYPTNDEYDSYIQVDFQLDSTAFNEPNFVKAFYMYYNTA